jgi:hypothetical protein
MATISQIEQGIEREIREIGKLIDELTAAGDIQAQAEVDYKQAWAKSSLEVRAFNTVEKLTVSEVEARVELETGELRLAHLIATNRLSTLKEAVRAAQTRLNAMQTLNSNFRQAGG